jgi:hypothetical protein
MRLGYACTGRSATERRAVGSWTRLRAGADRQVRHQAITFLEPCKRPTLRAPRRFTAARPQYHGAHLGHIGYAPIKMACWRIDATGLVIEQDEAH